MLIKVEQDLSMNGSEVHRKKESNISHSINYAILMVQKIKKDIQNSKKTSSNTNSHFQKRISRYSRLYGVLLYRAIEQYLASDEVQEIVQDLFFDIHRYETLVFQSSYLFTDFTQEDNEMRTNTDFVKSEYMHLELIS